VSDVRASRVRPTPRVRAARLAPLLGLVLLVACAAPQPAGAARLQHVVLFTLHDPADAAALLADCRERLVRIPGVLDVQAGAPVDIGRPDVAADYDVGLVVQFADAQAYRAYLADPRHQELVQFWKPRWKALWFCDFQAPAR
jgi:hypothetical protein